jgi:polyisoprenoid-binding protein YceI
MSHRYIAGMVVALTLATATFAVQAEDYVIDSNKAHAFIQFKISHLGYSWVLGRFNTFSGEFSYDENDPAASHVKVDVDVRSVDTNEAERDKHLRGEHYLDTEKYPMASFVSTSFKELGGGKAELTGNLTLHGVTKPITIAVNHIGHGKDPWGGYRRGFDGTTSFKLADFGITTNLGPAAKIVQLYLVVEGIRK